MRLLARTAARLLPLASVFGLLPQATEASIPSRLSLENPSLAPAMLSENPSFLAELPFGEEWNPQPGNQPLRFTRKERETETGFDYFGARYYGSKIGRFTTVDPVYTWRENLLDPQRWNRYAYARNNPLKFVAPDGRVIRVADQGALALIQSTLPASIRSAVTVTGQGAIDAAALRGVKSNDPNFLDLSALVNNAGTVTVATSDKATFKDKAGNTKTESFFYDSGADLAKYGMEPTPSLGDYDGCSHEASPNCSYRSLFGSRVWWGAGHRVLPPGRGRERSRGHGPARTCHRAARLFAVWGGVESAGGNATSAVHGQGAGRRDRVDYFGARYYRANIGRFTTVDPVYTWQENLVDPQRWNRYAYARNNPLRYVDPDGREIALASNVSKGDAKFIVNALTEIAARPGGRDALTTLINDPSTVVFGVGKRERPCEGRSRS